MAQQSRLATRDVADFKRVVIFVVATTQDAGKSTFAVWLAEAIGTTVGETSGAAAASLESRHQLAPGAVALARAINRNAYRGELGAEGRLMLAEGNPPAAVCLREGHGLIVGCRTLDELDVARHEAERLGLIPLVVCVNRPRRVATDITEGDLLLAASDFVVNNSDGLDYLRRQVYAVLDFARAYAQFARKEVYEGTRSRSAAPEPTEAN